MIQFMLFLVFFLLVDYEVNACDVPAIVCSVVCKQDGDDKGVMIADKCYCANVRDLSRINTYVPKSGQVIHPRKFE
jgi:hypothetical protein